MRIAVEKRRPTTSPGAGRRICKVFRMAPLFLVQRWLGLRRWCSGATKAPVESASSVFATPRPPSRGSQKQEPERNAATFARAPILIYRKGFRTAPVICRNEDLARGAGLVAAGIRPGPRISIREVREKGTRGVEDS